MKRIASLTFIGAFALASLTACSSGGDIEDFCAVASSLGSESDLEIAELSDTAMEDALAGDMSGLNAWGESSTTTIDEMVALMERAKKGSPTDEVTQALNDASEALDLMHTFASSAAESTDFLEFVAEAQALEEDLAAVDAKLTSAGDVLDAAEVEYCS